MIKLFENLTIQTGVRNYLSVCCFVPGINTNYNDLLINYCRDNNIDLSNVSNFDFNKTVKFIMEYSKGKHCVSFWVDN